MFSDYLMLIFLFSWFQYAQPIHFTSNHEWDLLIFTQSWPPTTCKIWSEKPDHTCILPASEHWVIHGIWPTKLGTEGPAYCNKTWLFDPEQVKPIETDLEEMWMNVEKETSLYSFWAHEWMKHGTCAAQLEPLNVEFKYFSKGLEWIKKYSMTDILNTSGIYPSDVKEFKIVDFHNAIKNKLGVDAAVQCRSLKGKQYLDELRICFKKDLSLTSCDGIVSRVPVDGVEVLTNCDAKKGVVYESTPAAPQTIILQLYRFTNFVQWLTF